MTKIDPCTPDSVVTVGVARAMAQPITSQRSRRPTVDPSCQRQAEVDEKAALMRSLGNKHLVIHLARPIEAIPAGLSEWRLALNHGPCLRHMEGEASHHRDAAMASGPRQL